MAYTPYSKMAAILTYSLNFKIKNEATRANLQVNKRILKWRPFWNKTVSLHTAAATAARAVVKT